MRLRLRDLDPGLRKPLLGVAGLVLLLCCCGSALGGFFLARPEQEPGEAARIATDAFVSRLIAGDYGGAYDQLCAETRERVDRDDFVTGVGARPAVRAYKIDKIEDSAGGFSVSVTLADPYGAAVPQVFRVVEDRGAWRICGNPLPAG